MKSQALLAVATALAALPAFAHDGHGLVASHWHASDTLGFVAVGGLIGLAVWLLKK